MKTETKHIISADGTKIGYKQTGSGEGLIIVHGGGRISGDYERLAEALADKYTVYTYDRRGRGMSGQITNDHCIEKECEDLVGLLKATGAEHVFGHSMGGVIALETATRYPITNIAVYEPAISVNNSMPQDFMKDVNKAIAQKRYERAMAHTVKGLQMHESGKLPVWLLVAILKLLKLAKGKGKEWNARMAETLPTLSVDMTMVMQLNNTINKYKKIRSLTYLMGGSKSPSFLLQPLDMLKHLIPYSTKFIFNNFYHVAPEENSPEIAASLKQFFN